jgi:Uri superfamily endonuclease
VKGSYVILIRLPQAATIAFGRGKEAHFPPGHYAYAGSALGGLEARLSRHLKGEKKPYWHIDRLLERAHITDIIIGEAEDRLECAIARALGAQFDCVPGFGSSDCPCPSHLFLASQGDLLKSAAAQAFMLLGVMPRLMKLGNKPR